MQGAEGSDGGEGGAEDVADGRGVDELTGGGGDAQDGRALEQREEEGPGEIEPVKTAQEGGGEFHGDGTG